MSLFFGGRTPEPSCAQYSPGHGWAMPPRQDLVVQPPVIRVEQARPPPPPPPGRLQRPPHDHPSTYLRRPANPPRDARLVNTVANTQ